jgi:DNA polymerase-3 subunit beta
MAKLLDRTTVAISHNEASRYSMNGALMEVKGQSLRMVATDGKRLAMASVDVKSDKIEVTPIVPGRTLRVVRNVLDKNADKKVMMNVWKNSIEFGIGAVTLRSNLVEGTFPPYEDVISSDSAKTKFTASTAALADAVSLAGRLRDADCPGVRFRMSKSEGLELTHRNPDAGESCVNFPCAVEGKPLDIGFSTQYFLDGLKVCGDDEVTVECTTPARPGMMSAKGWKYIVMPVSLT